MTNGGKVVAQFVRHSNFVINSIFVIYETAYSSGSAGGGVVDFERVSSSLS